MSLIVALLAYFGWTRTGAIYSYFGVDQSVLNLSIQDYLIRSGVVIFKPAAIATLFAATILAIDLLVTKALEAQGHFSTVLKRLLPSLGFALFLAGIWSAAGVSYLFHIPATLGAGLLAASAATVAISMKHWPVGETIKLGPTILVFLAFLSSLFWATSIYASESGTALAVQVDAKPELRPNVTILSDKPLDFGDGGASESSYAPIDAPDTRRYRYSGLRLFSYANSRWVIIDMKRTGNRLTLQILQDSDSFSVVLSSA